MTEALLAALGELEEASTDLIESNALQQRVDRKYFVPASLLPSVFAALSCDYRIVTSADRRFARYETQYFDTPDRTLYHDHRRGRRPRCKVRVRHHLDRRLTFLEIKRKQKDGRTTKARMALPFGQRRLDASVCRFIDDHSPIRASTLIETAVIGLRRVTLVGAGIDERVTLDFDLEWRDARVAEQLIGAAIAEIKQPRYSHATPAARAFRILHIREQAISKYCLATARLSPVRSNALKPALRTIERMFR